MTVNPSSGMIPEWWLTDRLRKARESAGMRQGDLAKRLEVSRGQIGNLEQGTVPIKRHMLISWALVTGVPLEWLETGRVSAPTGPSGGEPFGYWREVESGQDATILAFRPRQVAVAA